MIRRRSIDKLKFGKFAVGNIRGGLSYRTFKERRNID